MSYSINNLLNTLGADNIVVQNLDQNFLTFKGRRDGNEVTFVTEQGLKPGLALMSEGPQLEKACFMVFFDRKHLDLIKTPVPQSLELWRPQVNELRDLYLALKAVREVGAQRALGDQAEALDKLYHELHPVFS